ILPSALSFPWGGQIGDKNWEEAKSRYGKPSKSVPAKRSTFTRSRDPAAAPILPSPEGLTFRNISGAGLRLRSESLEAMADGSLGAEMSLSLPAPRQREAPRN